MGGNEQGLAARSWCAGKETHTWSREKPATELKCPGGPFSQMQRPSRELSPQCPVLPKPSLFSLCAAERTLLSFVP